MERDELQRMSLDELESLYASEGDVRVPTGVFRGTVLAWFPRPKHQSRIMRATLWTMFGLSPFGVDFDRSRWFFLSDRSPRLGHFTATIGASRWRDTDTVRLQYEVSRLPNVVRSQLYDEVKPLSERLCLGIGGLNADKGVGEQFFFVLERTAH